MTGPVRRTVDPAAPDAAVIDEAARRLRAGGLVAFPTETVYGLGANALDPDAVARVYAAKGRPSTNPLICHVTESALARHWLAAVWPPAAEALAAAFWPGPLTLVLPARLHLPAIVTAGTGTVAVRAPAHPVAQALLKAADRPIAAPSANRSTTISPTLADHVIASLGAAAEYVLDGGPTAVGIESTVVDLTGALPAVLRLGAVGRAALEAVVGPVALPVLTDAKGLASRAPGRQARHYAPATPALLLARGTRLPPPGPAAGRGIIGRATDLAALATDPSDRLWPLPDDPSGFGRLLYATLHEADAAGARALYLVAPPATEDWAAIADRLARATHPA